jgi:hypothetical protein
MISWMLGESCGGELGCNIPKLHVRFYAQEVFPGQGEGSAGGGFEHETTEFGVEGGEGIGFPVHC